ncbi:energy-coupling factor transporter transmembrane protein EcfT [Mycobacterium sp. DL592]|uniref:energy-coupling factor transporter transmembrane component T family protein n=1 Tax=Mycobacterium sp. DL592 TaxID=2675524 RepID=UPI001FB8A37A|nr:energy-coupling factor transporter transmembrane component T [Mycobacterium sp. DL592]
MSVLIVTVVLLLSIDWVSAAVALGCEALWLGWVGSGSPRWLVTTWPVWVSAVMAGITTVLYGQVSGVVHFSFGPVNVSDGSIQLAVATALRILAIGLPGVVLFSTTDPTDLADALAQRLRLPARFVLGGLAGLRLVGLFVEDWRYLSLARRARGLDDGWNLASRIRRTAAQAFTLLILAIRRGSKLATAMEAKGFGAAATRTWARPSPLSWADAVLVGVAVLTAVAAVSVSVYTGTWRTL